MSTVADHQSIAESLPAGQVAAALVDLEAIRSNTATVRRRAGDAEVIAVVKADGYGHGALPAARAALAGGASRLGVAFLSEAIALRAAGVEAPLMAWITVPGDAFVEAVEADVEIALGSPWALQSVESAARELGRPAKIHLEVDTGLGRGGATAADWPDLVARVAPLVAEGAVQLVGTMSHLACSDVPDHPSITAQVEAYREALAELQRAGLRPGLRHLGNSGAALAIPEARFDAVRPGVALYGVSPSDDVPPGHWGLRPAMSLLARLAHVKHVEAGHGVSYGLTHHTSAPGWLAVLPLGYGDGIPRHASDVGPVLLGGRRQRVAGRVCMDQVVLDLGDEAARPGDVVVLFGAGDLGEPTAQEWARAAGTIGYEIVTRIGSRVPRIYRGLS
jgi:alanine racemase